jgi:hypothetical protein
VEPLGIPGWKTTFFSKTGPRRGGFPTQLHREKGQRHPGHHLPIHSEVKRGYPRGLIRQQCALRRHHSVHRRRRAHTQKLMSRAPSTMRRKVVAPPPERKTPVKRRQLTSSGLEYENDYDHNLPYFLSPGLGHSKKKKKMNNEGTLGPNSTPPKPFARIF